MKIRSKVTTLLSGIFVILGVAAIGVASYVVMPSFAQLERQDARTAMRRIDYALGMAIDRIAVSATDWGNWEDTYEFVDDHNPAYVTANLTRIGLRQLGVNVFLIVDRNGNVVQSRDLDLESEQPLGLDLTSLKSLPADFPWRTQLRQGRLARGLLRSNRGILILAAAPVLDGNGHGPARGMVILGQLLSASVVKRIGAQAQAALLLVPPVAGEPRERLIESDDVTRVYRSFDDLYGRPIMTLRVDIPREITQRGRRAVGFASAYLLAAAVAVLLLLVVALNRLILTPLARVTRHAVALGEHKDLTTRLQLGSNDEIGILAREFDRMVERVAEQRTQLVDHSYQAGFAELAKGVLHNLGNAMTPIGVRIATLTERLQGAPADDVAAALTELRQGSADAQRGADLQEFLSLACQELALTVTAAREDLTVMSRQAGAIQTMLSEQVRSARNEQVIEPVRLTELVAQSLEIVPDACRQRLVIDADETLRTLGVVRVARTVLRLILQNLIINAADAVRDAGKERGVLHVSAEIVRRGGPRAAAPALPGRRRRHPPAESRPGVREGLFHQVARDQPGHRVALVRECHQRAGRAYLGCQRRAGPGRRAAPAGAARRP